MVSIAGLLKPLRERGVNGVEELAARLAAGETVPPEEVATILDRTGRSEDELQAAVDRHERVRRLRQEIATAEPMRRKLAAIDSEITGAEAEVAKAQKKLDVVLAKYGEERFDLRLRVEAADRSRAALVSEENLPPVEADRLRRARQAADDADQALTEAGMILDQARRQLAHAENSLPDAIADAKAAPYNADAQAAVERIRNAIKARRETVANAEKVAEAADTALTAARRERAAVEIAVATAAGA